MEEGPLRLCVGFKRLSIDQAVENICLLLFKPCALAKGPACVHWKVSQLPPGADDRQPPCQSFYAVIMLQLAFQLP